LLERFEEAPAYGTRVSAQRVVAIELARLIQDSGPAAALRLDGDLLRSRPMGRDELRMLAALQPFLLIEETDRAVETREYRSDRDLTSGRACLARRVRPSASRSDSMWHFLYFFPLPQWQGAFRPGFTGPLKPSNSRRVERPAAPR
jgi:hypothetical protein